MCIYAHPHRKPLLSWSGYGHVHGTLLVVGSFIVLVKSFHMVERKSDILTRFTTQHTILQLAKASEPNNNYNLLTHGI
jgi:hypothetical protein